MSKKLVIFIIIILAAAAACNLPSAAPTATLPADSLPAATMAEAGLPTETPEITAPVIEGTSVSCGSVSLILPPGAAEDANCEEIPPAEGADIPPWVLTPGHIQLTLESYLLADKFHQPRVFVYPAPAYAAIQPAVAANIQQINTIAGSDAPIAPADLPHVPFFNAGQIFASNIQRISFQNGQGVRFITEYAQYFAPANNNDLFYQFQGLSDDGAFYVVIILPITAPLLAENADAGAIVPAGGAAYPDVTDVNADWEGYYSAVIALLDNTSPDAFAPTLVQLDQLVESILITP